MNEFASWIEKNKLLWQRVYDEVIAPDLENEWTRRDEKHRKELKEKEENQQHLFEHLNKEIVAKAHLAKENEQLKNELRGRRDASTSGSSAVFSANEMVLNDELQSLTEKYEKLSKRYQDLSQKAKYLEKKNASVMQKNKDMKENVRAWQEYADRQVEKHKQKLGNKDDARLRLLVEDRPPIPSSPMSTATMRTPHFPASREGSSPAPIAAPPQPVSVGIDGPPSPRSLAGGFPEFASATTTPRASAFAEACENVPQQAGTYTRDHSTISNTDRSSPRTMPIANMHLLSAHPSSSQTTVDEHAERTVDSVPGQAIDDGDYPEFVSEKNLKRKRGQPSRSKFEMYADQISDGTPVRPFRVKDEPHSSPPMTATRLARTETFDLDDPSPNILQTPHHPRRLTSIHSDNTSTLRHQRSNSAPFSQNIKQQDADINLFDVQSGSTACSVMATESRSLSEPLDPTADALSILQPLDINIINAHPDEPPHKRSKKQPDGHRNMHNILAESDENTARRDKDLRLPPNVARAQLNRKLMAAKSPQSPLSTDCSSQMEKSTTPSNQAGTAPPGVSTPTPSSNVANRASTSKSRSTLREDPVPSGPIWTMRANEPRLNAQRSRPANPERTGRLKNKAWTELTLQDFKPNPVYNQGYTYAFSETVRNRADRLCLPGCTNSQCCGSTFRVLAEAQAPLSASQEENLLEEYLGDAYDNMQLTQMSTEERKELVLQARTKKIAKEAGKHREAYERRKTPPGFWRVDFPTTQEQQEDRERAKEQERVEVQQRWLEAQRKGGRWIFRDE